VACVYGVCGCHRQYISFHGQQGHCGSPVALRQDAFLAAAAATCDFKEIALKHDAYCTVGHVEIAPDVITISPGYCRISLDQRCIKPELLQTMVEEAQAAARKRAEENRVTVDFEPIWHAEPILFDAKLVEACTAAVEEETGEKNTMYSGPLHDAVPMNAVVPSVMMFAQSDPGISHCKEENTPQPQLEEAIRAFIRLAEKQLDIKLAN
jgi:acetylornithine deacetylase/succinyl-diaminopimelate desuccinylase-like protein